MTTVAKLNNRPYFCKRCRVATDSSLFAVINHSTCNKCISVEAKINRGTARPENEDVIAYCKGMNRDITTLPKQIAKPVDEPAFSMLDLKRAMDQMRLELDSQKIIIDSQANIISTMRESLDSLVQEVVKLKKIPQHVNDNVTILPFGGNDIPTRPVPTTFFNPLIVKTVPPLTDFSRFNTPVLPLPPSSINPPLVQPFIFPPQYNTKQSPGDIVDPLLRNRGPDGRFLKRS